MKIKCVTRLLVQMALFEIDSIAENKGGEMNMENNGAGNEGELLVFEFSITLHFCGV